MALGLYIVSLNIIYLINNNMFVILISSILFLYIIINVGLLASIKLGIGNTCTDIIFTGIVFINALVTILSLVIPINFYFFVFLFFLSLFFNYRNKKVVYNFYLKFIEFKLGLFFTFVSIFALYFAATAPEIFDTNFYHIQSIMWIEEYKVIPGLANIHGRFGFNSNVFTLFALTSFKPLFNQEILIVNYLTFIILVRYLLHKLFFTYQNEKVTNKSFAYFILLILLLFNITNLSSASPDFLSFIFTYYILIRTFELSQSIDTKEGKMIFPIIILSFYVLTIKLSTLPIILLPLILFYKFNFTKKDTIKLSTILVLIILPWLIRNTILSGWLIYPFPHIDLFSFDWKVPKELVIIENLTIVGWARLENHDLLLEIARMNFLEWFPIWFSQLSIIRILILALSFSFPVIYLFYFHKKRNNFILTSLIITSFVGLLFWLFMAPDFRFGKAFIYVAFISPLFFFTFVIKFKPNPLIYNLIFTFILIAVCLKILNDFNPYKNSKYNGILIPIKTPKPENLVFLNYKVDKNLFYYPNVGVQCYDQTLPCLPYLNRNISLRGNKIQDGFKYFK